MAAGAWLSGIAVFLLLCCPACSCHGFSFFNPAAGSRRRSYLQGEEVYAVVAPMATRVNTLPVDYYALPSCKPQQGARPVAHHLGELLLSDGTQTSPYRFRINVNESLFLCTTDPLTARDVSLLLWRKFHHYAVHMVLDDLPLLSLDLDYSFKLMRGYFLSHMRVYPVDWVYVINHLKFRILLHELPASGGEGNEGKTPASSATRYEIVGFEVVPCSDRAPRPAELGMYHSIDPPGCRWDLDAFAKAESGERLTFTYEVEYLISNVSWSSRWDRYYVKTKPASARAVSVLTSLSMLLILAALSSVKLSRWTPRDLITRLFRGASDNESMLLRREEEGIREWKLIAGDVFRAPGFAKLLCVAVGTGAEIGMVALICIVLAALGFNYPAPRGILLTWVLLLYLFFGFIGGYVGVWLWGSVTGNYRGWRSVCYWMAASWPGVILSLAGLLNLVYWGKGSSFASATVASYLCLLALWACVLLPSTCCGGFLAAKRKPVHSPVETNAVPRKMPPRQLRSWLLIFAVAYLPFSCILGELFLILHSICHGWYYSSPMFLLAATLLLATACGLTSVLITYNRINAGDWKWWWKSLLVPGFTGIYVFLYAIKYLVFNLRGFVSEASLSITVYVLCSLIAALAVMLASASVGFLTSFCFIRFLYASSKL
ncbi:hypothetical protein Taro_052363 [Colocasia esculenta]|uniref:Transmembrane 9 superfamily member n=1 Tax=Colocasia esculenta TaxID=4460 RepID=A0A843XJN1_COLES|nr:hypothetical protein [Colocasia esculenta]